MNAELLDSVTVDLEFVGGPADGRIQEERVTQLTPVMMMRVKVEGVLAECHAYEWTGRKAASGNWIYQWLRSVGVQGVNELVNADVDAPIPAPQEPE